MKLKQFYALSLALCLGLSAVPAYGAGSDVSLTVDSDNGGDTGGGTGGGNSGSNSGGGGSSMGGSSHNPADKLPLREGVKANGDALKYGYMVGNEDKTFDPNGSLTRAEFASILDRVFDVDIVSKNTETKTFSDIQNHWAQESIEHLATNGILYGVSSKDFNPEGTLRRDEALLMLGRLLDLSDVKADGCPINLGDHYAKDTLCRLFNLGIYANLGATNYDITATISRDEMVHITNRALDLDRETKSIESELRSLGYYIDLLNNASDIYYQDCIESIKQSYLTRR